VLGFKDDLKGLASEGRAGFGEDFELPGKNRLKDEVETARCIGGLLTLATSTKPTDGCFTSLGRIGAWGLCSGTANCAEGIGPTV